MVLYREFATEIEILSRQLFSGVYEAQPDTPLSDALEALSIYFEQNDDPVKLAIFEELKDMAGWLSLDGLDTIGLNTSGTAKVEAEKLVAMLE